MNTILVIEDEKALQSVLKVKLGTEGYTILAAENGLDALEILKTSTPDLILLDIIMPEMNGFKFMEEFKKDSRFGSIPVYILSNLSSDEDINKMKTLDAEGYIIKTDLDLRNIDELIVTLLKKHGKNVEGETISTTGLVTDL